MSAAQRASLDQMPEWEALATHLERVGEVRLRDLFDQDPVRAERY